MKFQITRRHRQCLAIACSMVLFVAGAAAQPEQNNNTAPLLAKSDSRTTRDSEATNPAIAPKPILASSLPKYYHRQDGVSINELIEQALGNNQELTASRLEIERARARLTQARRRPNPTLEFEQTSGAVLGSPGGGEFTVGASLPIEIYGRRGARIDAANVAVEASEADVRNQERLLVASILSEYAEALGALRELGATEDTLELDLQTARFVQIRVNEGDVPPLELNLLQAEIERLRARRELAEGRLESAIIRLKMSAGMPFENPLLLREQLNTAILPALPATREASIETALKTRPDILLTQIEERVATAGLQLVRATSRPDLTAYARYTQGRLGFDNVEGQYQSRNSALTFGVAVGLPIFNKNQGAKTEAEIAIRQAQARREYAERLLRGEILAAYQRYEAASRAVLTLENAAIPRSMENVETIRQVYEIGELKITDLIAEQRRLLDATRDLTEALTQKYRAQVDLNIALGAGGLLPAAK